MRRRLIASLAAVLLAPSAVHAALIVHIEQKEVGYSAEAQRVHFDVYLEDPDNVNEGLRHFRVRVLGPDNTPYGLRFTPPRVGWALPPSAAHPNVFPGAEGPGGIGSHDLASATGIAGPADVSPARNGLFAIPVLVPAGTPPGEYRFVVATDFTRFLAGGPAGTASVPIPYVVGQPGRLTVTPEPSSLGSAVLPALLLLRRRNR